MRKLGSSEVSDFLGRRFRRFEYTWAKVWKTSAKVGKTWACVFGVSVCARARVS